MHHKAYSTVSPSFVNVLYMYKSYLRSFYKLKVNIGMHEKLMNVFVSLSCINVAKLKISLCVNVQRVKLCYFRYLFTDFFIIDSDLQRNIPHSQRICLFKRMTSRKRTCHLDFLSRIDMFLYCLCICILLLCQWPFLGLLYK